jgi:hypothetical protein
MHIYEVAERAEQRDTRRRLGKSARKKSRNLVKLHTRLRSDLDDFLVQGDLWLLVYRSYPYVVLKHHPFFDDDLELTDIGRKAVRIIGRGLARFSGIYSLITARIDPNNDGASPDWSRCTDAWQQARGVEAVLVEAGADPNRVLSLGIARDASDPDSAILEGFLPESSFVTSICFTATSSDLRNAGRKRLHWA